MCLIYESMSRRFNYFWIKSDELPVKIEHWTYHEQTLITNRVQYILPYVYTFYLYLYLIKFKLIRKIIHRAGISIWIDCYPFLELYWHINVFFGERRTSYIYVLRLLSLPEMQFHFGLILCVYRYLYLYSWFEWRFKCKYLTIALVM